MCTTFSMALCPEYTITAILFTLACFIVMLVALIGVILVAIAEAKSKAPPVTGDDITKIIDEAQRRAYERGRYE